MTRAARILAVLFGAFAALPLAGDAPPATVKLPLAEYRRLRDAADEQARHPKPPAVSPAIETARLTVVPGDESAELTLRLEVNVPSAGNWKLPIPSAGKLATWKSEPPGAAVTAENNTRFIQVGRPGRYAVTSTEALPLSPLDGYSRCSVAAPAASTIELVVRLRSADEDVRLSAGAVARESGNVFRGTIPAGRTVALDFRARETGTEEARFSGTRLDLFTLAGDRPVREGVAGIDVLAGTLPAIDLLFPPDEKVESISGDGVSSWDPDPKQPGRYRVSFLPPAKGTVRLYWKSALEPGKPLVPVSIAGEDGGEAYVAAAADRGRELRVKNVSGLERADPKDLPPLSRALLPEQAVLLFRATPSAADRSLAVETEPFAEVAGKDAVISSLAATSVLTREGTRLDRLVADVRTKDASLAWPLPDGASIWSVFVNGKPVRPSGEGAETRIPLRGASGGARVDVVVSRPGAKLEKRGEIALSLFALPEPVLSLSWNVFLPDGKRYRKRDGNVWESAIPAEEEAATSGPPGNVFAHVTDEQGGALPGVSATLTGCGQRVQTASDAEGNVSFHEVPPCRYSILAELSGFASVDRKNVVVPPGGATAARIAMKIASVATTITVTSEAPLLDTRKQGSGTTFSQDELSASRARGDVGASGGVEGGVEGGVPGGVVGGVAGGTPAPKAVPLPPPPRQRNAPISTAAVAEQVQQGLKSLPIEVPNEGKLLLFEGRLYFGEEPKVTIQYK